MGYTIELSVLHELSLRGEVAPGVPVSLGEAPGGDPPSLVEPDSSPGRESVHTSVSPPATLPPKNAS
jgi:hypothetical protein